MLKDRLIFIISFAILGVAGAFLFRQSGKVEEPKEIKVEAVEKKPDLSPLVLTAVRGLKSGQKLTPSLIRWESIEEKDMNPTLIYWTPESEKWITDATVMKNIVEGEKIKRLDIAWPNENYPRVRKYKPIPLSPGKRALPIKLQMSSPLIQYMIPGKHVDLTFTSKSDLGFGNVSLMLLKNIEILDVAYPPEKTDPNGNNYNAMSEFAEVLLEMSPKQAEIYFFAEDAGKVSLTLSDPSKYDHYESTIEGLVNADTMGDFRSVIITYMMRSIFKNVKIDIKATPQGYIVSGRVHDPQMAGKIIEVMQKLAPGGEKNIVNLMEVDPQQVLLRVKVLEVSKSVLQNLGVNWDVIYSKCGEILAGGAIFAPPGLGDSTYFFKAENVKMGDTRLNALVNLIQEDGSTRLLAEPNLTTISGTTAHFFAGGEYPILVPQGGNLIGTVTVEYKKYGVLLDFTPFIDLNGLITLHVIPEVSALDYEKGVALSGYIIPGLIVRRADTVVKLWSGQSYIIAGLLENQWHRMDDHLYCLDRLPIIGPLFCSKKYRSNLTELVIIITPFLLSSEREPEQDQCQNIPFEETPWCGDNCVDNCCTYPPIAEPCPPQPCSCQPPSILQCQPRRMSLGSILFPYGGTGRNKKVYQPACIKPKNHK